MHPQHHRRLLLTSHVLCDAWAFGREESSTALPVCTAAIKRVLLPNLCVQGPKLTSREICLFLHDDVRPFTMSFVFKLSFECDDDLQPAALVSIMQRISATMPYLETLRVEGVPWLGGCANEFISALPSSLRVLQLTEISPGIFPLAWSMGQVQLLSKLPFLEDLDCDLSSDGFDSLLPLTLPAGAGGASFFPRLRSLTIRMQDRFEHALELYQRVLQSPLVSQLRALNCSLDKAQTRASGSISLAPLAHIERLSHFLECCHFASTPGFSLLENCRDLGDNFLFYSALPGAVDLSGMHHLEAIGSSAFSNMTQASSIMFPPTLRFIGERFCREASITEIDLSPCALEFVETRLFLVGSSLKKFDTTPLLRAIGDRVSDYFMWACSGLIEVDLAGLQKVISLGHNFLASCSCLSVVRGCEALGSVESIGDLFLCGTRVLKEFDFSQLALLRKCGKRLLEGSALAEGGTTMIKYMMDRSNNISDQVLGDDLGSFFD